MKAMKELPYTRKQQILEKLKEGDCLKVEELAKDFNVSSMTIYRDIAQLEKNGEAFRVYGGVMAANKAEKNKAEENDDIPSILQPYHDSTIEERFRVETESKQAIAKAAADFVKDGDIIAIDPSTTTLHMCPYLSDKEIIVVTTSMSVALQFASSETVNVIMCGGMLRKSSLSLVGSYIQDVLKRIHINKCFISSHGFTFERGLADMTMEESDAKHQMVRCSSETYVLIDHTKINKYAPFVACDVNDISYLITDKQTEGAKKYNEIMKQCEEVGCKVVFAE
ncbi:MAG: DeoR/GlpR family DNA-binding transcription regulator [Lachnospiraceae bacterium]